MSDPSKKSQWQALATGASMSPPGGIPIAVNSSPRTPETLTEKFNRAADPRARITALQKQMSHPKATLERTPLGTVGRSINPERDHRIAETIKAMSQVLAKKRQAEMKIDVGKKNQIKSSFNNASGMGM